MAAAQTKLKIGCYRYHHTEALFNGTVKVRLDDAGSPDVGGALEVDFFSDHLPADIFRRMVKDREFDAAELGWTFYLRTLEMYDEPPFIAIPIFPNRNFRHSAIYVNNSIKEPKDLIGKTVGEFGLYGHDAGVWPKGILSDEYGVKPEQCKWLLGASDWKMPPFEWISHPHPSNVDVRPSPNNDPLGPMLENGEISAFISAVAPKCYLDGSDKVRRLFTNYEEVERDYYRRTGIFPIMHTVVIRRDLLKKHPGLAKAIYKAFCDAKDITMKDVNYRYMEQHMQFSMPWITPLYERNLETFGGADWWPYGIEKNRKAVDTFLRYFHEQGLSTKRWTCEEVFCPDLLDT
ncbi:4,5-dihydroxyphthalate decarboxylase [Geranomyces variabilis]|nr:4,5-dihydroxyphthalate decarboxylase [Geranomyces variabilis]KAJ3134275.1 hypothetical protein HDU90_005141 [Geranomyces variabilis]